MGYHKDKIKDYSGYHEGYTPLVSVIVPNHGLDLTQLIRSVQGSTYKNTVILVIDRGLERSVQRNIGIKKSDGEYFLILDSDHYVSSTLIEECVWMMGICDAVYIPEILTTKGIFAAIRRWERGFYTGTLIDVPRFIKKDYCPLFDEEMSGPEDSDWDRRIIGRKGICKSVLYHNDNVGFFKYFKKKAYYSKSMERYAKRNPNDKILDWKWRCFKVFFENGKYKRFLSRPDLAICVLFIIFIRGVIYATFKRQKR